MTIGEQHAFANAEAKLSEICEEIEKGVRKDDGIPDLLEEILYVLRQHSHKFNLMQQEIERCRRKTLKMV